MNHSHPSQFDDHVEPWHLTAFALGELDPDMRDRVQRRIDTDPELARQLVELQQTLDLVQRQLKRSVPVVGLDEDHTRGVFEHMQSDAGPVLATQAPILAMKNESAKRWNGLRIGGAVGALALAASVLLLFQYNSGPQLKSGPEISYVPLEGLVQKEEALSRDTVQYSKRIEGQMLNERVAADTRDAKDTSLAVEMDAPAFGVLAANGPEPAKDGDALRDKVDELKLGDSFAYEAPQREGKEIRDHEREIESELESIENLPQVALSDADPAESSRPEKMRSMNIESKDSEAQTELSSRIPSAPVQLGLDPAMASKPAAAFNGLAKEAGELRKKSSEKLYFGEVEDFQKLEETQESTDDTAGRFAGGASRGASMGGVGGSEMGPSGGGARALASGSESKLKELSTAETDGIQQLERSYEYRLRQIPDELKANVPSANRPQVAQGDRFDAIPETPFVEVAKQPLSTFSIDVDTASYSKLRQYVIEQNTLPSPDTVRIEEWINYFDYEYPGPTGDDPFAAHLKMGICPWNTDHKLVRVAIQAKKMDTENRPDSNLVFLIDVSGSMAEPNKLPLVKRTLNLLASQLRHRDRVAIVVYAGAAGCVLPSTPGSSKEAILASINELQSGGSTNGGQGIELAYRIAKENFIPGGVNRVILCTDGDFNVGVTGNDQLVAMMKENAASNVFLTCLGYGIGNYNDSMMEQISNQGNGTYGMVDSELEARRIMIEQLSGTLMTVAKDVKIQVEFNPNRVGAYRLIGYENRRLAARDFDDDRKDAGEIGAGHRVTALYEIVPAGMDRVPQPESELRYGNRAATAVTETPKADIDPNLAREWMLLKIRSKKPEASESTKQEFVLTDMPTQAYDSDGRDMDWASSVAEFGLLLRHSQLAPGIDWDRMIARAQENAGSDPYRRECLVLMQQARRLSGR